MLICLCEGLETVAFVPLGPPLCCLSAKGMPGVWCQVLGLEGEGEGACLQALWRPCQCQGVKGLDSGLQVLQVLVFVFDHPVRHLQALLAGGLSVNDL